MIPGVAPNPTFGELVRVFARIGCLSFGGPAGQIALMHRELVEERAWVSESEYLQALNLCHLLPGPEAQQLATWVGWKLHGTRGGVAAGGFFVLPGALVMLALSMLYAVAANLALVEAIFLGVKAAVLAIVVQALIRVGRRALKSPVQKLIAAGAFVALFAFAVPFPAVVLAALVIGAMVSVRWPDRLPLSAHPSSSEESRTSPVRETVQAIVTWIAAWALPMTAIFLALGPQHVLWDVGLFFSRLAIVTFGGAYAVLAYMAQEAVNGFGWLQPGEMVDGLGLAETTPGPLIMVTQFVGFLAAYRDPAPFSPLAAGVLGALVTTWVTFTPCFLWIFMIAPWMRLIEQSRGARGALAGVTAAVVGVIANLTLWFAIHVLFAEVSVWRSPLVNVELPRWETYDWRALLVALVSSLALFRWNWGIARTLVLAAVFGLILVRAL